VAEAVLIGPVSGNIFPANREKNREFGENRPLRLTLTVIFISSCNDLRANSLCELTANFFRRTAYFLDKTGKRYE
jgi:hypothetical protein